jgi:hypothetical protein
MLNNIFFPPRKSSFMSRSIKTTVQQMVIWRMCIACWICEDPNTQSECVMLTSFPLQQRSHESASRYITVHCLSCCIIQEMGSCE